jgi:hypothetical protein
MSRWPAAKAQRVLAVLLRIGWTSNGKADRIALCSARAGRISCSRFMTGTKSARACSRASLSTLALVRTICKYYGPLISPKTCVKTPLTFP